MKILYADIETSPCAAWVWSTGKQYINHEQILEPTKIICIAYKWEGKKEKTLALTWDKKQCDKKMLKQFSKILTKADVVIAHNGIGFDVKHINARLAFHKLPSVSIVSISDSLLLSRRKFRLPSHSLNYLAKYFNVGAKVETGGIALWLKVWLEHSAKALKKMVTYCKNDVTLLEKVYDRLRPYLDIKTNLSVHFEDSRICPSCGGKLHKKDIRQVSPLKKVQRYECYECSKVVNSGTNLLKHSAMYPR